MNRIPRLSPRRRYPTDLTAAQWAILEPLVPAVRPGGRPATHARRESVDAQLYVLRGGISWRSLPHEYPPWQTVYASFRRWRDDGTWELCHLWVAAGDSGKGAAWIRETFGWTVEVVKRPQRWIWLPEGAEPPPMPTGFQVLKRRWVVERTFAWLGRYRRLSKDYDVLPATEEAWIYLATTNLMLRRLAR